MLEIIYQVRQEKTKANKPMNAPIKLTIEARRLKIIKDMLNDLKSVTNSSDITEGDFAVVFN